MDASSRGGDHLDDQNVDWSLGLSLFGDFDPNLSFLDDSSLLPGFSPDWQDYQQDNVHHEVCQTNNQENSLTSHEASSDDEQKKKVEPVAPRKRGRPRKVQPTATATLGEGSASASSSNHDIHGDNENNREEDQYIFDYVEPATPSQSNFVSNKDNSFAERVGGLEHASSHSSSSSTSVAATTSSTARRCITRRAYSALNGGEDSAYLVHRGTSKPSVTGRKKATEEARSVLMDWLNDNKEHPYPTRAQKAELAACTGLTVPQIVHWMSNVRKRRLIPLMRGKREPASKIDRKFLEEIAMRNNNK